MPRFYDGTPGRTLVRCPDCGCEADEQLGGDHGGTCERPASRRVIDGPAVVKAAAQKYRFLSVNSIRGEFVAAGVPEQRRGPAFRIACQRGWIEHVGYEPSTDPRTKKHSVKTYRSHLIPGAAVESIEGR